MIVSEMERSLVSVLFNLEALRVSRPMTQGAEESCLTVMPAQFIAELDLVIQNNEHD